MPACLLPISFCLHLLSGAPAPCLPLLHRLNFFLTFYWHVSLSIQTDYYFSFSWSHILIQPLLLPSALHSVTPQNCALCLLSPISLILFSPKLTLAKLCVPTPLYQNHACNVSNERTQMSLGILWDWSRTALGTKIWGCSTWVCI